MISDPGTKELIGRSAVVTGAANGIGFAVAKALAGAGASVCLADINDEALENAADKLQPLGTSVLPIVVDVSSETSVNTLAKGVFEQLGHVDILVNNAGLQYLSAVENFPLERWDALIGIMLRGAFLCTQRFVPRMAEVNWGRVINIASIHSIVASPFKSAYISAKHGLIGLTKTVALETARKGVTVNAISPAYVRTALVEKQIEEQARLHSIGAEEVVSTIMLAPMPQKELIEPDEIGETAKFLCSSAARHITGHNLVIDGGWTVA